MKSDFEFPDKLRCRQILRPLVLGPILILALLIPFLSAQTTTGSIAGTVQDSTGGVLADAKVTVSSSALVVAQSALTTGQGTYRFPVLPPGTYVITVEAPLQMAKENIKLPLVSAQPWICLWLWRVRLRRWRSRRKLLRWIRKIPRFRILLKPTLCGTSPRDMWSFDRCGPV